MLMVSVDPMTLEIYQRYLSFSHEELALRATAQREFINRLKHLDHYDIFEALEWEDVP